MLFLRKLLTPSVDSVVSAFTKTIDRLDRAAQVHNDVADAQSAIIQDAEAVRDDARAERDRALIIRQKIARLVS